MGDQAVQHYTEMSTTMWVDLFGDKWNTVAHKSLDFSSDMFTFLTLGGSSKGLLNPDLNLQRLKRLNLHRNCLSDVDDIFTSQAQFASSMKHLILSQNLLTQVSIDLPHLNVLDLSANQLSAFPMLDFFPNLEVLNLARNRISRIWDTIDKCPSLKSLDISDNWISLYPSQLEWGLYYFLKCPNLSSIGLAGNPFTNWFPEHVYFFMTHMPKLRWLDQVEINMSQRSKLKPFPIESLQSYDAEYDKRRLYQEATSQLDSGGPGLLFYLDDIPSLHFFLAHFNKALESTDDAIQWCMLVSRGADLVYTTHASASNKLFELQYAELAKGTPKGHPSSDGNRSAISLFLQNLCLLSERYEPVRSVILRALVKFGCVPDYSFGPLCLSVVGDMMMNNDLLDRIGMTAITESLVPCIQGRTYDDLQCLTVLQGIAAIKRSVSVAAALSTCTTDIITFIEDFPTDPVLIAVLRLLIDHLPNAIECSGQGIEKLVGYALVLFDNKQLGVKELVKYLYIGSCCASSVLKAAKYFVSHSLHTKYILENLKDHFRLKETYKWPLEKATLVASMMDFLTGIISQHEQGMVDCVDRFHFTDLLLIAVKEDIADPLVLSSSCRGLVTIMSNPQRQTVLLEYITEQAGRFEPLLQYLGGRLYKDLCIRAEQHTLEVENLSDNPLPVALESNLNPHVHDCFCSILRIFLFFLQNTSLSYCVVINEYLSQKKRERYLFRLLANPNNSTRYYVVRCLEHIPIHNFSENNVLALLNLLKIFRTFTSEEAASIIVVILTVLQRFIDDVSEQGGKLITRIHVEETFDALYELLYQTTKLSNTARGGLTIKTKICVACCNFLRGASYHQDLRQYMRKPFHIQRFGNILKAEEDTFTPHSQDVPIERCWTGRDVTVLIRSFTVFERLNPLSHVAFRVMSQLADVLEGRNTVLNTTIDTQTLVQQEEKPFDGVSVRRNLSILDESEFDDRIAQQQEFFSYRGPEKILGFVSSLSSEDFGLRLAKERKEKRDSEYWAGRFKAICEDTDKAVARGDPFDEEYGFSSHLSFFPKPHRYHDEMKWKIFQALHRTSTMSDPKIRSLHFRYDSGFYVHNSLWSNPASGEIRKSIILAALIRCFFSCLIVPVSETVSLQMKKFCRRPATLRKIIALLETVPLFDCHIGAKFFLLMRLVITLEPHQAAESMDLIIIYDLLSRVIQRLIYAFGGILEKGNVYPLGVHEQAFATELSRLVSIIIQQTSWIKFSSYRRVHRWAICYAHTRLMGEDPISFFNLFVQMLMYDSQISSGSTHGTFIEHLLQITAESRERMRISCLNIFSEIIQRCDPFRYEALELLNHAQIFQKKPLRKAFLFELLEAANAGHYSQALQHHLSVKNQRAERVLQCPVVHRWVSSAPSSEVQQVIVAATSFRFYCIAKPPGIRNFTAGASHTSLLNADPPTILLERPYCEMTKIVRGYPSNQVFIICWSYSNRDAFNVGDHEINEVIISDTLFSTHSLLNSLLNLADASCNGQFGVYNDKVFRSCLKSYVSLKDVLIASYVLHCEKDKTKLVLHVLTQQNFYEFDIDWTYWFSAPPELIHPVLSHFLEDQSSSDDDDDDKDSDFDEQHMMEEDTTESQGLDNFLGFLSSTQQDTQPLTMPVGTTRTKPPATGIDAVLNALPPMNKNADEEKQRQREVFLSYREKLRVSKEHLLTMLMKHKIERIHSVIFNAGEEPWTMYEFAKKARDEPPDGEAAMPPDDTGRHFSTANQQLKVIYLDDTVRERWKRHVACILNKLEASRHWRRTWRTLSS